MYTQLLQIIATIDWNRPEQVRQKLLEFAKEVEDKIIALDARVKALGG